MDSKTANVEKKNCPRMNAVPLILFKLTVMRILILSNRL